MGFTQNEKGELASFELKDVSQARYTNGERIGP